MNLLEKILDKYVLNGYAGQDTENSLPFTTINQTVPQVVKDIMKRKGTNYLENKPGEVPYFRMADGRKATVALPYPY